MIALNGIIEQVSIKPKSIYKLLDLNLVALKKLLNSAWWI